MNCECIQKQKIAFYDFTQIYLAQTNKMDEILDNSYFKNKRKEKYSFPKSSRFPEIKPQYTIDYYDQSSTQQKRTTSFGYGSKYDFFRDSSRKNLPSPFQYSIDPERSTRGLSFGMGRDAVKSNSYIDYQKLKTPNASKYETNVAVKYKKKAPSCVIISKHPQDSFIKSNDNPDPGNYHPVDTFYSRRKRSAQFGFGSAKRFDYDKSPNRMVGPGSYAFSPTNKKNTIIGHAPRKTYALEQIEKSITPGPKYYVP